MSSSEVQKSANSKPTCQSRLRTYYDDRSLKLLLRCKSDPSRRQQQVLTQAYISSISKHSKALTWHLHLAFKAANHSLTEGTTSDTHHTKRCG
eukprot:16610-Heterococcus_DN1.PRE.13